MTRSVDAARSARPSPPVMAASAASRSAANALRFPGGSSRGRTTAPQGDDRQRLPSHQVPVRREARPKLSSGTWNCGRLHAQLAWPASLYRAVGEPLRSGLLFAPCSALPGSSPGELTVTKGSWRSGWNRMSYTDSGRRTRLGFLCGREAGRLVRHESRRQAMARVAGHLSVEDLEAGFRSARDPTAARHFQVIWLLARG